MSTRSVAVHSVRDLLSYVLPEEEKDWDSEKQYFQLPKGMLETPTRVVKMFEEMTRGYRTDVSSLLKTFDGVSYGGMVIVRGHKFVSLCEHHLVMFEGRATVGYIPSDDRVVGLSKLARVVDAYAYRFQVQERLTEQIADAIEKYLQPKACGVVLVARHLCMCGRGVDSPEAETITSSLKGHLLTDIAARAEFMRLADTGGV